jgi:hypothetical protein
MEDVSRALRRLWAGPVGTQVMVAAGHSSGLVKSIAVRRYIERLGLSRTVIFFTKKSYS